MIDKLRNIYYNNKHLTINFDSHTFCVVKTLVINPGTVNGWFFGYRATAVVFDTKTNESELLYLYGGRLTNLLLLNNFRHKPCIHLVVHCLRLILQDFDGINFHIFVLEIFDTLIRVVG